MSQIYKSSASGPAPPTVPTQFTTDDGSKAIPAANNLNVLSTETTDDNINGIQTRAVAPNSDNLYIELTNRISGFTGTNDGAVHPIITFPLGATPGTYKFDGNIEAYNTTSISGACYGFQIGIRTDGATGTIIGVTFDDDFEEAAMSAADFNATASGNNLLVTVTGIVGQNIDWRALVTYRFVG